MKRSKLVPRSPGLQRERSPPRKLHSRKPPLHHSPQRSSSRGHVQRSDSSIKQRNPRAKRMRSPSIQSPPASSEKHASHHSHDSSGSRRHLSHKKQQALLKRDSQSPMRRELSAREMGVRSLSPGQSNRYRSSRERECNQDFVCPPKKKPHRVPEKYVPDRSPPGSPVSRSTHHHSESFHRTDFDGRGPVPSSARDYIQGHSNERHSSSPFSSPINRDRYHLSALEKINRPDESRFYLSDKRYGQTLNQRFSSYSNSEMDSGMKYSHSDLQKITVDIRHPVRASSPTIRRIINASEVKILRRPDEGNKPIFEREEIKWAGPNDKREDSHYEQRHSSSLVTSGISHYGMTCREQGNYEMTRQRFGSFQASDSSDMRTLNDRCQDLGIDKLAPSYFDRDERVSQPYVGKSRRSLGHSDDDRLAATRSRSNSRDYHDAKFNQGSEPPYRRDGYSDRRPPLSSSVTDLRHGFSVRRNEDLPQPRDHIPSRRDDEPHSNWRPVPRSGSDINSDKMKGKRSINRGPRSITPERDYESRRRQNSRGEEPPSYAQKTERFEQKSWSDKPGRPSRSPGYFEHSKRYSPEVSSDRFSSQARPPAGRTFPFWPYRGGGTRGGIRGRGMFRGRRF